MNEHRYNPWPITPDEPPKPVRKKHFRKRMKSIITKPQPRKEARGNG